MTTDFKTTREIVLDLKNMDGNSRLEVMLVDVSEKAQAYMHSDKFATARKLLSLNDICQSVFDYDQIYEAVESHKDSSHNKEVLEEAFVEALEFADEIQETTGTRMKELLKDANGYAVGGISCRGQLVVGVFK